MKWVLLELISLILIVAGCATASGVGPTATVRGEAFYRERIAVPPGTQLEVVLSDISRADAPAETIADTVIADAGQPPYKFEIHYQPDRIIASHRYAVRARLTHEGRLLFTTDQTYPVITSGNPTEVRLLLKHVAAPPVKPMAGADRDEHSCIRSAGYSWCARENACVRPWELAKRKGFALSEETFRAYCSAGQ